MISSPIALQAQEQRSFYEISLTPKNVLVGRDGGGNVALYIVKAEDYRADQSLLAFNGRCDSSCTLLLSLSPEQICLMPGASFRFHAPIAKSTEARKFATEVMMEKYPNWVKSWISEHGGLKPQLIIMDYQFASLHIQSCDATIY